MRRDGAEEPALTVEAGPGAGEPVTPALPLFPAAARGWRPGPAATRVALSIMPSICCWPTLSCAIPRPTSSRSSPDDRPVGFILALETTGIRQAARALDQRRRRRRTWQHRGAVRGKSHRCASPADVAGRGDDRRRRRLRPRSRSVLVFPLFGLEATLRQSLGIGAIFTLVSLRGAICCGESPRRCGSTRRPVAATLRSMRSGQTALRNQLQEANARRPPHPAAYPRGRPPFTRGRRVAATGWSKGAGAFFRRRWIAVRPVGKCQSSNSPLISRLMRSGEGDVRCNLGRPGP